MRNLNPAGNPQRHSSPAALLGNCYLSLCLFPHTHTYTPIHFLLCIPFKRNGNGRGTKAAARKICNIHDASRAHRSIRSRPGKDNEYRKQNPCQKIRSSAGKRFIFTFLSHHRLLHSHNRILFPFYLAAGRQSC